MSIFFDNDYEPGIIDETSIDDLEMKVGVLARPYPLEDLPNRWAYFSYLKGLENGLSEMYSINFGYIISSFISGMGVDAGTDIYFRMGIDEAVFDIYEDCNKLSKKEGWTEEKLVTEFFHTVLLFYKSPEGACKYEKAAFHHNIRVGSKTKTWFLSRKQSSKQTLNELMNQTIPCPQIKDNGKKENITFKFTYSEEESWNKLEGENDSDKLRSLLSDD